MANTMSQPQIDLVNKLKVERDMSDPTAARALHLLQEAWREDRATKIVASGIIGDLLKAPVNGAGRKHLKELDPGIYKTPDDHLIRVYLGQNSGRMLAKMVVVGGDSFWFQYMGVAKKCVPEGSRRLTVEEVGSATLALDSTICLVCGRRLDDPESVQRGIGPICRQNYGV